MFPTQIWIVMKQSPNLELNEPIVEWDECEMLTYSQQQSQAQKNSQKGVNSQVDYQNHNALGPPKVSPLQA